MRDPTDLPSKCDGCGASLTLQHALDCKVGGLVIQRHNEIRDCVGDIAAQVWTQVVREPIVREAETQVDDSGLRLDLGVRGVWQPQAEALFDFKVIDTDAPSYSNRSPESVLESGAQEKKRIYRQAVEDRRGTFTPFVTSVDGLLHREAEHFLKRMAMHMCCKQMEKVLCTNMWLHQSKAFICHHQSSQLMPKGFQSKVEKWPGL